MEYPRWPDDTTFSANLREVYPGLFVGGMIAVILVPPSVGGKWPRVFGFAEEIADLSLTRYAEQATTMPFQDGDPIPEAVLEAAQAAFLAAQAEGKPILFACQAGASRSASCAAAVLVRNGLLSEKEAVLRVRVNPQSDRYPLPATLVSGLTWAKQST